MRISESAFPITSPETEAGKTALELHATLTRGRDRLDKIEDDHATAGKNLREAKAELDEALFESERSGGKRTKRVKDAEVALKAAEDAVAEPWRDRAVAANRSIDAAIGDLERHINENLDEILSEPELNVAAVEVTDRIIRKAEELSSALDEWREVHDAHVALVGPADWIDGQAVRSLSKGGQELSLAVRKFLGEQESGLARLRPPLVKNLALNERRAYLAGTLEGPELDDLNLSESDRDSMRDAEGALAASGAYDE